MKAKNFPCEEGSSYTRDKGKLNRVTGLYG